MSREEDRRKIVMEMDACVNEYASVVHDPHTLIALRRRLAVLLYAFAAHAQDLHGQSMLTYVRQKHAMAKEMLRLRAEDPKMPVSMAEARARADDEVLRIAGEHVMADSEREALIMKVRAARDILAAMQQEIAQARHEQSNAYQQDYGA